MALTDFLKKLGLLKDREAPEAPAEPGMGATPEAVVQPEEAPQETPQ